MRDTGSSKGFKWMVWGVVTSAAMGMVGCGWLPQQPGNDSYHPGFARGPDMPLYSNGTIEDHPTSIDPRTPDKQGAQERSLMMDPGERVLMEQRGVYEQMGTGGSGPAPAPGSSPYLGLGAAGSVIVPSNQAPTSQSLPANNLEAKPVHPTVLLRK